MILALIFLSLAVVCRGTNELYYHGKLKWQDEKNTTSFWGTACDLRKYRAPLHPSPNNWYYKFAKLMRKEKFPLSGTLLVWTTDGPHFMQFMFFNFLSLSITFSLGFEWLTLGLVWALIHVIHFIIYRILQK